MDIREASAMTEASGLVDDPGGASALPEQCRGPRGEGILGRYDRTSETAGFVLRNSCAG
jgi:hypothetical protein